MYNSAKDWSQQLPLSPAQKILYSMLCLVTLELTKLISYQCDVARNVLHMAGLLPTNMTAAWKSEYAGRKSLCSVRTAWRGIFIPTFSKIQATVTHLFCLILCLQMQFDVQYLKEGHFLTTYISFHSFIHLFHTWFNSLSFHTHKPWSDTTLHRWVQCCIRRKGNLTFYILNWTILENNVKTCKALWIRWAQKNSSAKLVTVSYVC